MSDSKELQVKDKQEVAAPAEQTRPGVVFTPDVDIFENDKEITLLADMPEFGFGTPFDIELKGFPGVHQVASLVGGDAPR